MKPIILLATLLLTGCKTVKEDINPGVIVEPVTVVKVQYVPIPKALTEHGEVYIRPDDTVGSHVQASERNTPALIECHKQLDDVSVIQGSEQ